MTELSNRLLMVLTSGGCTNPGVCCRRHQEYYYKYWIVHAVASEGSHRRKRVAKLHSCNCMPAARFGVLLCPDRVRRSQVPLRTPLGHQHYSGHWIRVPDPLAVQLETSRIMLH